MKTRFVSAITLVAICFFPTKVSLSAQPKKQNNPSTPTPAAKLHSPAEFEGIYKRLTIDDRGLLHIFTANHREIAPRMDNDQVGFEMAAISRDKKTVGWLALYPNCCTSYPIPLKLVLYRNGKVLQTFTGTGLPVWKWQFVARDHRVSFSQETVHGAIGIHFELRNINTGRLIDAYEGDPMTDAPDWVHKVAHYELSPVSAPARTGKSGHG